MNQARQFSLHLADARGLGECEAALQPDTGPLDPLLSGPLQIAVGIVEPPFPPRGPRQQVLGFSPAGRCFLCGEQPAYGRLGMKLLQVALTAMQVIAGHERWPALKSRYGQEGQSDQPPPQAS